MKKETERILSELKSLGSPKGIAAMEYFGMPSGNAFGISTPVLKAFAKPLRNNHLLALDLWKTGIHEAQIMAAFIDEPEKVTDKQMDEWVADMNSWGVCDGCCTYLFRKTPFAYSKAIEWSYDDREFVKRAGFALMAVLAVHDKQEPDKKFIPFLKRMAAEAKDDRNFVKKAVNWALRQTGKRNLELNRQTIEVAKKIREQKFTSAKWIAADALRELQSDAIKKRLKSTRGGNRTRTAAMATGF